MEHLLFNCHGEATMLLQALAGLGSFGGLGGLLGLVKAQLSPARPACNHDHNNK